MFSLVTTPTALAGLLAILPVADDGIDMTWDFEHDATGKVAAGFETAVGRWEVVELEGGKGKALAQLASNANAIFNVALAKDLKVKDVDLSVRLQSIAGVHDQGGGVVWRARDSKNYYIARYNPLEDNLRVYHVVDGKRTQLQNADIEPTTGWHALRVTMSGDHIQVFLDGKKHLDVRDAKLTEPGTIGLWSKADARTQFDDLTLRPGPLEEKP